MSKARGLFVGLATLDLIYLVSSIPQNNEKIVALQQAIAAGGPATNAAITFSYLGFTANLLTVIGNHPISNLIKADLDSFSVNTMDLEPHRSQSPAVSSILVTEKTGERAIISVNASKYQTNSECLSDDILQEINIVLIDGHQMAISLAIAQEASSRKIPVVIDGGSWKDGWEKVLPFVNYAICSENFYPPNCQQRKDVFTYLQNAGINHIAITQGEKGIEYLNKEDFGKIEVDQIQTIDTLGAGDIFHGAFCYYILQNNFLESLSAAAKIASDSCKFFGTRQWMV